MKIKSLFNIQTMPQESVEASEARYAELFKKLDKGNDGRIDIKDLISSLKESGFCESYAEVNENFLIFFYLYENIV